MAVNLFKTKRSCGVVSLKMLKLITLLFYFVETAGKKYSCEFIENKE